MSKAFAISIPHFRNLTLNTGCYITPSRAGCPLVFKCSETLTLNGGHIDLRNKGDEYSPWFTQELSGTLNTDKYSGWENSQTKDRLHVNSIDGAAFIIAKSLAVADSSSRIGNPTMIGEQFYRGASDNTIAADHAHYQYLRNATNVGGSTILLVAETITDFVPDIIAKYRDKTALPATGYEAKGLASCYIASNTLLPNDEGLYAYDCISDPARVPDTLNIKSFGDGSSGSSTLTSQLNNYALVTAFDETRKVLTVSNATNAGAEPLAIGRLVMIHFHHKTAGNLAHTGRFILAKILGINGDDFTLDTAVPNVNLDNYYCQIISIPQFADYTLSGTHSATPAFRNGIGGIFAIAVKNTCDLSGGIIDMAGKGHAANTDAYGQYGLKIIGNAQDAAKLPIGQGKGSVFILANNLVMNSETRIGATYSGANFGGGGGHYAGNTDLTPGIGASGGGYSGTSGSTGWDSVVASPYGGCPIAPTNTNNYTINGGRGSCGRTHNYSTGAKPIAIGTGQGAHIMIIADTITGFNQAAISTGGAGATSGGYEVRGYGADGGAGYGGGAASSHSGSGGGGGGGGGYQVGGYGAVCSACVDEGSTTSFGNSGAGSGWAFVYCNNVVNQDTTDTVL